MGLNDGKSMVYLISFIDITTIVDIIIFTPVRIQVSYDARYGPRSIIVKVMPIYYTAQMLWQ